MKKLILPIFALVLVLSSCTDELTNLNEDPKGASEVPGETLFTNAQVSLGTYLNSADVNLNIFKLISQYWASSTYTDESQFELTTRSIPSNLWSELYRDVLNDLESSAQLIEEDELLNTDVKQNQLAQIEILETLTYYELINIFGNIPYTEALNADNPQPVYDDAEMVYMSLMDSLDTAIGNLNPSADGFGEADIFYNGDVGQWVKFANSLKMRMGITIADSHPDVAQAAVEEASPNAFTSNADNAVIPFVSAPPHTNPIWEAEIQSNRDDFLPANTLVDHMNNLEDPRRPILFTEYQGEYKGGIYGLNNTYANFSHFGQMVLEPDFEGMILEYPEVEFIRAEAIARGWNVSGTVTTHYNNAIRADMEYWGVSDADITSYLTQPNVIYDPTGDYREQIGLQKWLALYLQGLQGWTEWRRLDAPTLNGVADPNVPITEDDIPTRFTYPVDEQNLNESNWEEASSAIGGDQLGTQLFWDVE
ncbi:Starch-binding associating with outer membrane [Fodinibius roseus]|uniref:Starch-binding associating with outer membrane n=1 Tax=Fodinibius roseus TaxID=1194090 RepID=A0A1M5ANN1_9BACT|nr:SusD/RagB family nutrient-binding outer membrane lipoprotein [Fodinibius roseus]SHF31522.1 Starch-binding associating with outer membrane [Fodinibius roseus]